MDVKDKVIKALQSKLPAHYIRLEDEDGISGFVVSPKFKGMSMLDRQTLIDDAINNAPDPLTPKERRRILMIAGLTPVECVAAGAGVRVHRLRELPDGSIEVLLHGGLSDAEYVRGIFKGLKGVRTTEPEQSTQAQGIVMQFRAMGSPSDPLTRDKALRALKGDRYISLTAGV